MNDSPGAIGKADSIRPLSPHKYADVALPVAVDKTFTYLIPPELGQAAEVGVRVLVPFGRKYTTGLVVALPTSTNLVHLKPIRDVLDASPVVADELLRLCFWIAEYYVAPLGEVVKAAIPHGFSTGSKRLVRLSRSAAVPAVRDSDGRSRQRDKLLSLLAEEGPMLINDLKKKLRLVNINAVLNQMEKAGLIETEEVVSGTRNRSATREFIVLHEVDETRLSTAVNALSPRKKRGRRLLNAIQFLQSQGVKEASVRDLLKNSGTSSETLKEFKATGLVRSIRRGVSEEQEYGTEDQTLAITLNDTQVHVLSRIMEGIGAGVHRVFLLHGVTGSGKTQVYIEAIRRCLEKNKSAIVLVPEISLTPQIVRRFKSHFPDDVAVVHSRMSAGERHDVWRRALSGQYRIVIGPRSAIFAPVRNLGLIVVDEEHEASYKQFDASPRYNARDVANVRGTFANAVVVLGSATPSAESYYNALSGKYELLDMPRRIDEVRMPDISIVDMIGERKREYEAKKGSLPEEQRGKLKEFQQSSFSALLRQKIEDRLSKREGIILLQNRRGFAPFMECVDCGYTEMCENCNVTLTYHLVQKHLRCHYCGSVWAPHVLCPRCKGPSLRLRGIGTQRVEQELELQFPQARVLRMDLDTTSGKGAHERLLRAFGSGKADILLGTQMVAKGLDFPHVTLVGVISADTQMLLPDFRSSERTFQLLTQVAGRAGRSTLHGEVVIQTHQPRHYTLQHVIDHDFKAFYEQELQARKELDYPPFSRLVLVETKGVMEQEVESEASRFARLFKETEGTFTILGPSPAVVSKVSKQYRWHTIIKNMKTVDPAGSHLRYALRRAVSAFERGKRRNVRLIVDVDPVGLM